MRITEKIREDQGQSEACFALGSIYASRKENDKAVERFNRAIELNPNNRSYDSNRDDDSRDDSRDDSKGDIRDDSRDDDSGDDSIDDSNR